MTPEKELELACKKELEKMGAFVFKISAPSTYSRNKPGLPDLIALFDGIVVFLEIKVGTNKQSKAQKDIEIQIKEKGGNYFVIYSVEQLLGYIHGLKEPK